ncbi:MAG TPA: hypothetical protein VFA04_03445 [Bryobacteraceae bacterium]|nr:hypothetical protein [Bryobacteraceae bacterium]
MNRDGTAYAWNCRGLPIIRLTLDDGTVMGPLIAVTVDTVGDPLTWESIPVDALKSGQILATASSRSSVADPFNAGPPFSIDEIVQRVGIIADKRLSSAIASRGISSTPGEEDLIRLRRAGASIDVVQAVLRARVVPRR